MDVEVRVTRRWRRNSGTASGHGTVSETTELTHLLGAGREHSGLAPGGLGGKGVSFSLALDRKCFRPWTVACDMKSKDLGLERVVTMKKLPVLGMRGKHH